MRPDSGGSSVQPSSDSDMEEMMRWAKHLESAKRGGPQCEFQCGRIIAKTLTSGDNPVVDLEEDNAIER